MPAKKPAARSSKAAKAAHSKAAASRKAATRKVPAKVKAGRPVAAKPHGRTQAAVARKPAARSVAKGKTSVARSSGKPAKTQAKTAAVRKAPPKKAAPQPSRKTAPAPAKRAAAAPAPARHPVTPTPPPIARAVMARPARAVAVPSKHRRVEQAVADEEEGLEADRHSLLLGPRNVTPYVERRGEAYMSKQQLDHFRGILTSWKRDLMEEVDRTMNHMKDEAANPPDPNDRATLESEFALELRTRDRERKLIRKIDEALGRIEDGSYGYCLETGEAIGVKRLEARPVATLCIEAQERRERRERQYGDRDDWYR